MMLRQAGALVLDTLREARARKLFLSLFLNGTVTVTLMLWYMQTVTRSGPYSTLTALRQMDPRYLEMAWVVKGMLGVAGSYTFSLQLLFTLMSMLGLLPVLLDPARNATLTAMPVSRTLILLSRFAGCLAIAAAGITYTFAGIWIAAGVQFEVWHLPVLAGIGTTLLGLTGLFALMLCMQTIFDSAAIGFVITTILTLVNMAAGRTEQIRTMTGSDLLARLAGDAGHLLPRITELSDWTAKLIGSGEIAGTSPLWSTLAFALAMLAASVWLFSRRDF